MTDKRPPCGAHELLRATFVPEWEHSGSDERRRKKACQELARHVLDCPKAPQPPPT
jgi:hypothetical protein